MGHERWANHDVGTFRIHEMQCETCIYKNLDPMVCEKYPDRKPNQVLRGESDCQQYEKVVK